MFARKVFERYRNKGPYQSHHVASVSAPSISQIQIYGEGNSEGRSEICAAASDGLARTGRVMLLADAVGQAVTETGNDLAVKLFPTTFRDGPKCPQSN